MRALTKRLYALADFLREALLVVSLWLPYFRGRVSKPEIPVVASMTTYPPRIGLAWIAIETLLRQSVRPHRLLLVLSEEAFPGRVVPSRIRAQTRRGLELLWVEKDGRSYDKLIPVRQEFPGETIVTFDDDKYFPSNLLEDLFRTSLEHPRDVIGSRGWIIREGESGIHYGSSWDRATPGMRGQNLLTPGGNGCLYPPTSMDSAVNDLAMAFEICPTADDIWFWGALQKAGSTLTCLGYPAHRPVAPLKSTVALSTTNQINNDTQFQRALDYWGIRDSVSAHARGTSS